METQKLKPDSADVVANDPLAEYEDREPTKEEIMDDIRQGLRDMKAGYEGQDAMELLRELRQEIYGDADEGRASRGPGE